MAKVEAPTFIHSEAERAEMLTKMQDIAGRDVISAEELEEVGWLILVRDDVEPINVCTLDDDSFHGSAVYLPSMSIRRRFEKIGRSKFVLESAKRGECFDITMLDGVDPFRDTGEMVRLSKDEDRGGLRWNVGIFTSMYSEILGRRIEVEASDYVMAVDPLSHGEHVHPWLKN